VNGPNNSVINLLTNITDLTTKIQALPAITICILHPIPYPHLPDWALLWVYLREYHQLHRLILWFSTM